MKMKLRKQIKLNAKRCLCNNWGKAVSIVLLTSAIYLLFVIIEMIANLLLQLPASSASAQELSSAWMLSYLLTVLMAIGSFILLVPLPTAKCSFGRCGSRSTPACGRFCTRCSI